MPYQKVFGHRMLPSHRKAVNDIINCMTTSMGGNRYHCRDCDETFWCYHGCRNRSCPKCHGRQIEEWIEKRSAELLPCDYFHMVATVPEELRAHFFRHQKYLYALLMKTVAAAVLELARNRRFMGAMPGIMAVLHTWTGQMHLHPHVHLLITGGGVSEDGAMWRGTGNRFLVPVKKLSPMIGKRFSETLEKERPDIFSLVPTKVWKKEWCSFCKYFGTGGDAILKYLARYIFRIAITKNRIQAMDETHVAFKYKDHTTGGWKTERITGVEFIRRFLLHVLPRGFHKVRYYGLWIPANRKRMRSARVLLLLSQRQDAKPVLIADLVKKILYHAQAGSHAFNVKCPKCNSENVGLIEHAGRGGIAVVT